MSKQRKETDGLSMFANPYLYANQNWIQMINATTCGYKSLNFLREQRKANAETSLIARTKPLTGYVIRG
uniref:Uncharacterized protein n=1 Tax=Magallana gigas TaxID=29159 RepID=K1QYE1_MAGGI